jgi:hypothetical protein
MIPIPFMIAISIVIIYVTAQAIKVLRVGSTPATPPAPAPTPPAGRSSNWQWWLKITTLSILVIALAGGTWFFFGTTIKGWFDKTTGNQVAASAKPSCAPETVNVEAVITRSGVTDPTLREYEYSKEGYPGQHKCDDPRYSPPKAIGRAFLITNNPRGMTFRVEYTEQSELKTVLFSLDKTLPSKVGVWYQREPRFSGKWFLKKMQTITNGYCICVNSDSRPDLGWHDAYLTPK